VSEELKQEFTQKAGECFRVANKMYEVGVKSLQAETIEID